MPFKCSVMVIGFWSFIQIKIVHLERLYVKRLREGISVCIGAEKKVREEGVCVLKRFVCKGFCCRSSILIGGLSFTASPQFGH